MQSFRTELENPIVEKDIINLHANILLFRQGKIHEEEFRSLRLARGVYGQRQKGVQMVRIKLPYGKMTFQQWKRIADVSDEYSTGNLHLTTRQDIQIHFVSLDRTPELWAELEKDEITIREACGNTVRNITASETAGIDPNEPFDVSPYAHEVFSYFLRNPVCQEMGRKIKIAFSSSDADTALTFMHDMGFIPKIKDGKRGFKLVVGGGLGAQPILAHVYEEFLEENLIIPTVEAILRVFDRHGERTSRNKARMKYLIQKIGFDTFKELVQQEWTALKNKTYVINSEPTTQDSQFSTYNSHSTSHSSKSATFQLWLDTNVIPQKQEGYSGVYVRIPNGNISTTTSRSLISQLENLVGEIRVTINQGLFFRFVKTENLEKVFNILETHGLAKVGANSIVNITSCPGTDTCNLAISDSSHISIVLEEVIENEFPDLIKDSNIQIKISGCMNSCGQHGIATIGFHGSSLKAPDKRVLPAVQVLLGGGVLGDGHGRVADKVIKIPTKRAPDVLRRLLNDYENNALEGEYFNDFYIRKGEKYFYELLKPLADLSNVSNDEFIDWGASESFYTEIGVGECAAVMIDLVQTLLFEAKEKQDWATEALNEERFADAIYFSYAAQISAAKALLIDRSVSCSTHHQIISKFDEQFADEFDGDFKTQLMAINQNEPSKEFAIQYLTAASDFVTWSQEFRELNLVL